MTQDIKDMQTTPSLTLDPFKESAAPEAPVPAAQEEPVMDENVLSDEERRMADQFAQQIDLTDSSVILQYGAGTQKKMADFSESALENVRTKDLGEVGELLSNVVQ
ncbi:MAG: toxic anion resistance protein, partial [Anaerovoracaceae bacterium]